MPRKRLRNDTDSKILTVSDCRPTTASGRAVGD
jgi:hypothetical protein